MSKILVPHKENKNIEFKEKLNLETHLKAIDLYNDCYKNITYVRKK